MGAGSGGFYEASREMNRIRREMNRWMRERAERRAWKKSKAEYARAQNDFFEGPARADFPCFFLCDHCGYIDHEKPATCPACTKEIFYDLSEHAVADQIRDLEERRRHMIPGWVRAAGVFLGILLLAVPAFIILSPVAIILALFGIPLFSFLLGRPLAVALLSFVRNRPYRWRLPLPLPNPGRAPSQRTVGEAAPAGDVLTAPFSGRPCVAYQACVMFDTPGDARPAEWVLQEVEAVDFGVDGRAFSGERVAVRGPLESQAPSPPRVATSKSFCASAACSQPTGSSSCSRPAWSRGPACRSARTAAPTWFWSDSKPRSAAQSAIRSACTLRPPR